MFPNGKKSETFYAWQICTNCRAVNVPHHSVECNPTAAEYTQYKSEM